LIATKEPFQAPVLSHSVNESSTLARLFVSRWFFKCSC